MEPPGMNHEEHRIQSAGVALCRAAFPICRELLYAVPNGGARDAITGKRMKDEGVLAGVFDLALDVPKTIEEILAPSFPPILDIFHGLKIEVKTPAAYRKKNHGLTAAQMRYKDAVEKQGYQTAIVDSSQKMFDVVKKYLNG